MPLPIVTDAEGVRTGQLGGAAHVSREGRTARLTQLHKEFMREQRFSARLSPVTLRGYQQSFALLVALMPTLTVEQLSSATLTEFFRRLETRSRGTGAVRVGVKNSTIATYRSKLGRFFKWLAAQGHIQANPFTGMPAPRVSYEDRKFLGRSAIERMLSALLLGRPWRNRFLRKRNLALFATLLYTGVRKGELLALRVTDLDLDRLELTIRPETSKSRLRRVVPINSALCLALEDYLDERRRRGFQTAHLFTSIAGHMPLTANGLKHLVEQVKRVSGVRFHVHQFRHTFAVNYLNRGGDVAKLKQLLGHRDIRMTSVYLRALPTSAMKADVESVTLDTLL